MPIPSFSPIVGADSEQILDSLEKQRKELQWLLQHLDSKNVKELNAEVINAGRISAKYLKVGSETEFEDGYDTRALFEVTNDRITLEVEELDSSIATLNIRADSITQSVTNLNNNLSSRITQTASEIRSEVSAQVTTINNNMQTVRNDLSVVSQTASQIQSTVTSQQTQIGGLGTRMSTAESNIIQNAYQIQSKVSMTDFTGNSVVSMINQTATTIDIHASKINLVGAVNVLSEITGQLGTINAGTINGVQVNSANIRITDDVYIGNVLHIGDHYWDAQPKMIKFGGGSGGAISHRGDRLEMNAVFGVNVVDKLTVNYQDVALANMEGLSINYNGSSTSPRIYFRLSGRDLGYISLAK